MILDSRCGFFLFALLLSAPAASAPAAAAQAAIRVESNQVVVSVVVFDKRRLSKVVKKISLGQAIAANSPLLRRIAVLGLQVRDFRLFEDGRQRVIQSVTFEGPNFAMIRDNLGRHPETVGTGGGRWTYPDLPDANSQLFVPWPQYMIAYVPPVSPPGSCHQIEVKVDRRNSTVWARSEYCNTSHPAFDPLKGTEFGNQMEADLASVNHGKIAVTLQTDASYTDTGTNRVNLGLTFPWSSLKHELKNGTIYASIGLLGVIYAQDGTVAARFSDFACCDYGAAPAPSSDELASVNTAPLAKSMLPDRFDTQIDLAPGQYDVRVVLSDGENFGRAEKHLDLQGYNAKELAVSPIIMARRVRALSSASPDAPAKSPGSYIPLVSGETEFIPAVTSTFKNEETLYPFFEVYVPPFAQPLSTKIAVHIRVLNAMTDAVRVDFRPVDASPFVHAGSNLISIGRSIDLSDLPGGSYRLEVQASLPSGESSPWRAADFTLEPADISVAGISSASPSQDVAGPSQSMTVILFDLSILSPGRREDTSSLIARALNNAQTSSSVYLYLLTSRGALYPIHALPLSGHTGLLLPTAGPEIENTGNPDDTFWTPQISSLLQQAVETSIGSQGLVPGQQGSLASATFHSLAELGEQVARFPGSKTILWITAGAPDLIAYPQGCQDVMFAAQSASYLAGKCGENCPGGSGVRCLDYSPFFQHISEQLLRSRTVVSSVMVGDPVSLASVTPGTPADALLQLANLTGGRAYLDGDVTEAIASCLARDSADNRTF